MGKTGNVIRSSRKPSRTEAKKTKRPVDTGPVPIRFNQDCLLYAIDGEVPLDIALAPFVLALANFPDSLKPGTEWLLFGGTPPTHWLGYTTWIGVSGAAVEAIGDVIRELVPSVWAHEANEFCNPAREPSMEPVFRVTEDGAEVLEGAPLNPARIIETLEDSGPHSDVSPTPRAWTRVD